jgi:[acyl-carrier-protein] S-malonyltransferase
MAAIIGLELETIEDICSQAAEGQVVSTANVNSPQQVAIAGHTEAVERACDLALEEGARRALRLPVSAPFHCQLMEVAQEQMRPLLEQTSFESLRFPLVNNVDAAVVQTPEQARDGLVRQIASTVQWTASVQKMNKEGVDGFVEVGPGKVLSGLVRRIVRGASLTNVENPKQVEDYVRA